MAPFAYDDAVASQLFDQLESLAGVHYELSRSSAHGDITQVLAPFGGRLAGPRLQRVRRSHHFHDGRFVNPLPTRMVVPGTVWRNVRHQLLGREERVPKTSVPVERRVAADYASPPASGLRVTWMGHASALVEIDGHRVLTDPVWSERCSPSALVGPRRFFRPPIRLEELPFIDVVVISHDHFDHLDMATVRTFMRSGMRVAVPLGVGTHLEAWGADPMTIVELDWHKSVSIAGLTLTATPARHYSGRSPLHLNETLWSSWVMAGAQHRVFFSGDSGYFDAFKEIAKAHAPFDLALLKIGGYDETWQAVHVSPEEAVQIDAELGARLMVPIHWATFNVAFHAWNEPAERVVQAAREAFMPIAVPRPGQMVDVSRPPSIECWWR